MSTATIGAPRRSAPREFVSAVATIMVKELRSRMRGRRAFIVLTLYLAVLALITYGVYLVATPNAQDLAAGGFGGGVGQANASAYIGESIFSVLSIFQIILVSVMAPAFTAGQISLEREKQTLDLLISTPMRPGAIIIGKLLTALAFVALMVVSAIPITAIVLMYGGASVLDIVRQQVVLLSVAVGLGAVGIFASALLRRTQAATVLAYCTVLALTLGSAMVHTLWNEVSLRQQGFVIDDFEPAPEQLRYLNPMVGMLDIVAGVEATGPTRFTQPLYQLFGEDISSSPFGCEGFDCGVFDGGPINGGPLPPDVQPGFAQRSGYWWPRISISFLVLAAVLTLASMRLVVPAGMRWAFRRRRPLAASGPAGGRDLEGAPMIEELGEAKR